MTRLEVNVVIGRSRARRFNRRSGMRGRRGAGRRGIRNLSPVIKLAGLIAAGAAVLAVLIIFVIVPLFSGDSSEPVVEASPTSTPTPTPIITGDISDRTEQLAITPKSIHDPFIYGTEVVFTSGDPSSTSADITSVNIFDTATQQTTAVPGITKKYDSLFEPKVNDKYIVYLDCKNENGGAVCGYDRASGKSFVMREYLYGKPKVSLSGKYAVWMQQTGPATDKLYLYDLETQESVVIEIFINTPFSISPAYASKDAMIYVQAEGESQILDNSSAATKAQISIVPLKDKGDASRVTFCTETNVYAPMIDGDNIVFLNGAGNEESSLMLVTKSGDSYTTPKEIAKNVLNYIVGDGYVVYTKETNGKDEAVFIYYFKDGSTGRLSNENTRAYLASANGKDVLWYDIMGGFTDVADVVIHIKVP